MRREDFKEINEEYLRTCKKIIENNGDCKSVKCWDCPFGIYNLTSRYMYCGDYLYPDYSVFYTCKDKITLMKAKMFVEMFRHNK